MSVIRLSDVDTGFRQRLAGIAALFCFLGLQYGTWASRLPAIVAGLDLNTADVGLLLLACGVGAGASFPLVALLMRKLGSRRLAGASALCLCLVLVALAVTPDYPVTLVIMCCDGIAVACLNVAMNAQGAALEVEHGRAAMSRLHATFSGGSLAAALLASGVTALSPALSVHFGVATAVLLLLAGYAWSRLLVADVAPEKKERRRFSLTSRMTICLGFAMVFGTVAEGAMNDWSALYLKDIAHAAASLTPMGIAVFSAMMVLARLFADGWRSRWGDRLVVLVGSALAGVGLAVALVLGGVAPALIGFTCVGLGIAAVTPCVYAAAARQGAEALTVVAAMGVTGLLAGPPAIGFVANAGNLVWGMSAVVVSALLVCLCASRIDWAGRLTE